MIKPTDIPSLNASLASLMVAKAVNAGCEIGVRVSVAVVDAGGHLVAFQRADGASWASIEIAQDKAYTAVGFGRSTCELGEFISKAPFIVGETLLLRPRTLILGGGVPLKHGETTIGGIGVSGAPTSDIDILCANAALEATGFCPEASPATT